MPKTEGDVYTCLEFRDNPYLMVKTRLVEDVFLFDYEGGLEYVLPILKKLTVSNCRERILREGKKSRVKALNGRFPALDYSDHLRAAPQADEKYFVIKRDISINPSEWGVWQPIRGKPNVGFKPGNNKTGHYLPSC